VSALGERHVGPQVGQFAPFDARQEWQGFVLHTFMVRESARERNGSSAAGWTKPAGALVCSEARGSATAECFRNPFLAHRVSDILTYHEERVKIRLVPTRDEFVARFGSRPALLKEAIAGSGR
jgi:hypothetical protein